MADETIPIVVEARDELTAQVARMVEALERLAAGHEEQKDSAEDADKAEQSLGDTLAELADTTAIMERATQLAGAAWAAAGYTYGKLSEGISASLAAWDEQSKKSGKSASALGSVTEASDKLDKTVTKLLAQIGKMIERSGSLQVIMALTGAVLEEFNAVLKETDEQGKATAGTLGGELADSAGEFFAVIRDNSSTLAKFVVGLGLLDDVAKTNWLTFKAFINLIRVELYQTLEAGAEALSKLLTGLERMSEATGVELPESLRTARVELDGLNIGANKLANGGIADLIDNVEELGKTSARIVDEVLSLGNVEATINRLADAGEKAVKKVKAQLDKGGEKRRGDLVTPEEAAAEARAAALLDLDRQILAARQRKNEELAIELEREKELVVLGQSLREIKTSTLRDATQSAESLRIQIEYEDKLKELEQTRRDDRAAAYEIEDQAWREQLARDEEADTAAKERYDLAIERIKSRYEYETEQLTQAGDLVSASVGHIPELLDQISDSTERMLAGFAGAAQGISPLISSLRAYNAVGVTTRQQQDALNAGLQAGVGILSSATSALVADKKKQAAIEALINAAAAAAAYATGNIPMGIGFTAAAAGYAAAAAFGGGGGGGSSAAVGGAGAGGGGLTTPDLSRERELNAEAIANAIKSEGAGGGTTIVIDFGSSTQLGQSPEVARQIVDAIAPELARMIG